MNAFIDPQTGDLNIDRTPKKPSNAPGGPVSWVLTDDDLMHLVEALRGSSEVVLDIETTGLNEHATTGGRTNGGVAARVSLLAVTLPQADSEGLWDGEDPHTYIVPLSHPQSPFLGRWVKVVRLIARVMVKYKLAFVNANTKFDARWIFAVTSKITTTDDGEIEWEPGIDVMPLITWDTKSSSHLIDETLSTKLKERAPLTFGIERWDDHDLTYPGASEEVDLWELGEYAARDTWWTWRLYRAHLEQLFLDPLDPFAEPLDAEEIKDARLGTVARMVTMPTSRCLGMIEQRGIRLDVDLAKELLEERLEAADSGLTQIAERYDMPRKGASTASAALWFRELTTKAEQEHELRVLSRTGTGTPQWTKFTLSKNARGGSELAEMILKQRDAEKQAQFLSSWLDKVTPRGLIHASYNIGSVATGRLSSQDPNMQQVSKKLRQVFIPREGNVLADLDYSQLELRVAAFISRSVPMMEAYAAGQDLHSLLAADILSRRRRQKDPSAPPVPLGDVTADDRQGAKSANFGLLFGQQPEGFRSYADKVYGVEFSEEESQEMYDGFFTTWDGMAQWHEQVKRDVARRGYAVSPIGRVRNLPNIYDGNEYLRMEAERQALNAPVQGFGSDLMQMAIASIYGEMPGTTKVEGAFPVATVHDSLVAEIREDGWEEIVEECQERMTNLNPFLREMGVEMDVPLVADATVGTRWGWSDISEPAGS